MDELSDIHEYLAEQVSENKADAFVEALLQKVRELENHPGRYAFCQNEKLQEKGYRCIRFNSYLIIYFVIENLVQIIAIMNAKRNPKDFDTLAE